MDTSEQYINMCRRARELQETWEPKEGDVFVYVWETTNPDIHAIGDYYESYGSLYGVESWENTHEPIPNLIWLPRLDQLIELLSKESPYWTQFNNFELFRRIADVYDRDKRTGTSEQRILELLMGEKYNTWWNGEDWI